MIMFIWFDNIFQCSQREKKEGTRYFSKSIMLMQLGIWNYTNYWKFFRLSGNLGRYRPL